MIKINIRLIIIIIITIIISRKIFLEYLVYKVSQGEVKNIYMANKLEYDNHTKNLSKIIKNLSNTKITLKKKPTAHLFGLKFIQNSYDLDLSYYNNIIRRMNNNIGILDPDGKNKNPLTNNIYFP